MPLRHKTSSAASGDQQPQCPVCGRACLGYPARKRGTLYPNADALWHCDDGMWYLHGETDAG